MNSDLISNPSSTYLPSAFPNQLRDARFFAGRSSFRTTLLVVALGATVSAQGQTHGAWTQATSGGLWSDSLNWASGKVADGAGATADFSTVDLPGDINQVVLDSDRALGNLLFGDANAATPGTWELTGAHLLTIAGGSGSIVTSVDTSFGTGLVLGGSAGFTKAGPATLLLQNPTTALTGDVRVSGGTLALGNSGSTGAGIGAGGIILGDGATLSLAAPGVNAIGNAVTLETGAHAIFASASLTNSYGGNVSGSSDAVLALNGPVSFGISGSQQFSAFNGTVKIPSGSQLRFAATGTGANGNGGSNATFEVDGILNTRNRANAAGVAIGALTGSGQLQGQTNTAASFVIYRVGGKNIDSSFSGTFVNGAQGPAYLDKLGSGTLTLTGDSPATGNVTVSGGTLRLGNGGLTGSFATPSIAVAAGANLALNRDGTLALSAVLSGAGRVIQQGPGTTVLSGSNTHTAGTEITGGILEISADGNLGDVSGPVLFPSGQGRLSSSVGGLQTSRPVTISAGATGGLSARDADDSLSLGGTISGGGALAVSGAGTVVLAGANDYLGSTTITSGTLVASNASGSSTGEGPVNVNGGALAGAGEVSGAVHVSSSGSLRPGNVAPGSSSVGTLKTGPLSLDAGATLRYEFGGANGNDIIQAGGLAVSASAASPVLVDLRLENTTSKWVSPGTYTLIEFPGSFSGNVNDLFEVAPDSVQNGLTYSFGIAGGALTLTITGGLASEWKNDAAGTWATATNWINGVPNSTGAAVLLGTAINQARIITLGAAAKAGVLTFDNDNTYTVSGSAAFTLQASTGNASVSVLRGSHAINSAVQLVSSTEITAAHATDSFALGGIVSGIGGIVKSGPGTLSLTGSNTFSGGAVVNGGTLRFGPSGLGSGALTLSGATLLWNSGSLDITNGRTVTFGSQPVVFDTNGSNVTLAQSFGGGGSASLVKTGGGTLTIANAATHAGGTLIEGGTLRLGSGGANGSVEGEIANNGELVLNRSGLPQVANLISGTGNLVHAGAGTTSLGAANTFLGTTRIDAGKLNLTHPLALQNSSLGYQAGGGTLGFSTLTAATLGGLDGEKNLVLENDSAGPVALTVGNNGNYAVYSGILSGSGSLVKAGPGTQVLEGNNAHSGNTEVRGGALEQVAGSINTGSLQIVGTARFSIYGGSLATAAASNVSNAGGTPTLEINDGSVSFSGGLNATGNQNLPYLIKAAGGTLTASSIALARSNLNYSAEPAAGDATRGFYVVGGAVEVAGNLDIGTAPGVNVNSSASTRLDLGSLTVHGATTLGQATGARWSALDVNGGNFVSTDAVAGVLLGGPVTGSGVLIVQGGSATVERIQLGQAANLGSGVVAVSASGALYVGSGGVVAGSSDPGFASLIRLGKTNAPGGTIGAKATWSTGVPVSLAGGGTFLAADAGGIARDITLAGPVSGAGDLTKAGAGTLSITGAASYTGTTRLQAGTLKLSSPSLADAAAVEISGTAILRLDHTATDGIASLVIDGVPVTSGVWGAPGSGAAFTSPRLAGTGKLLVGVVDPFAAWVAGFGLTGNDLLKSADPDHDGQTNLLEFALDGNPASAKASGKVVSKIAAVTGGNALVLTLPVRSDAVFGGTPARSATVGQLAYFIEGSNNVGTYDQTVEEVTPALGSGLPALSDGWTYRSFRLSGDPATRGPRGFLRARIEEITP